jgi:hypothetical protein
MNGTGAANLIICRWLRSGRIQKPVVTYGIVRIVMNGARAANLILDGSAVTRTPMYAIPISADLVLESFVT